MKFSRNQTVLIKNVKVAPTWQAALEFLTTNGLSSKPKTSDSIGHLGVQVAKPIERVKCKECPLHSHINKPAYPVEVIFLILATISLNPGEVSAYADPGSGAFLLQTALAIVTGLLFFFKTMRKKVANFFRLRRNASLNATTPTGSGKQSSE